MDFEEHKISECQELLRAGERCAEVQFRMLPRFADLPACEELLAQQMKEECPREYSLVQKNNSETDFFGDSQADEDSNLMDDFLDSDTPDMGDFPPAAGEYLKDLDFRGRKMAAVIFQTILDWCNINGILLGDPVRPQGVRILYLLAKAMCFLNYSMTETMGMELGYGLVYGRKALYFINLAIGEIQKISEEYDQIREIVSVRLSSLYSVAEDLQDHLENIRDIGRSGEEFE